MRKRSVYLVAASILVIGLMLLPLAETPTVDTPPEPAQIISLLDALEATDARRRVPFPTGPLAFPTDHGTHTDQSLETWQFAGRVSAGDGRPFGFRLNLYRLRLIAPGASPRPSAWAARHLYWAQLAVTDVRDQTFQLFERYSRDGPSLAGMKPAPLRLVVDDWRIELPQGPTEQASFRLRAGEGPVELELVLAPVTGVLPLSGAAPSGDAGPQPFRGYRLARMEARGILAIGAQRHDVGGSAWLEHAWGDIPLPVGQVVWSRFNLQLDDGTDVAIFQLRRRDGSRPPTVTLVLTAPDGKVRAYEDAALSFQALREWRSPVDGTPYPLEWRLTVPSAEMTLDLGPAVQDQEVMGALRYWSGQLKVTGQRRGKAVEGWGFADLFGYAATAHRSG